jgi:hypothetical protein
MSYKITAASARIAFTLILFAGISTSANAQQKLSSEQEQVVKTVSTIFTAAQLGDTAMFDSVISPDFYMFNGGVRFNGDAVMTPMKAQRAAGKRFEWTVTEPDVHITGSTAWIAYLDKGSVTDASGTVEQPWLVSAFLEKKAGAWKVAFLHSTRIPAKPQEKSK